MLSGMGSVNFSSSLSIWVRILFSCVSIHSILLVRCTLSSDRATRGFGFDFGMTMADWARLGFVWKNKTFSPWRFWRFYLNWIGQFMPRWLKPIWAPNVFGLWRFDVGQLGRYQIEAIWKKTDHISQATGPMRIHCCTWLRHFLRIDGKKQQEKNEGMHSSRMFSVVTCSILFCDFMSVFYIKWFHKDQCVIRRQSRSQCRSLVQPKIRKVSQ